MQGKNNKPKQVYPQYNLSVLLCIPNIFILYGCQVIFDENVVRKKKEKYREK